MYKEDRTLGTRQKAYLSSEGIDELLQCVPRCLMSLDLIKEEGDGEVLYPLQSVKRVRCSMSRGESAPVPIAVIETLRNGSVVHAYSCTLSRSEINSLGVHSDRVRAMLHGVARANGVGAKAVAIQQPQMMTVYKYLIHQKVGEIYERGSWCPSRMHTESEGLDRIEFLSSSKPELGPYRMDIWLKRIRVPSYEELREQVLIFLLKLGVERVLKERCNSCKGKLSDGHTCVWPNNPEGKLALLDEVGLDTEGLNGFVRRVNVAMDGVHYPEPGLYNFDELRQRCTTHVMNKREVSVELEHLMRHLSHIEALIRGNM